MEELEKWESLIGKLYAYLLQNVQDKEIAEDILHDAFLKILEKRQYYRYKENYDGWAFRITKNVLIDYYRKSKANTDLESLQKDFEVNSVELDTYRNLVPALKEFLESLPEKYSKPLILSDIEGFKQEIVAQKLILSVSCAKSRIQRARKMLKEHFLRCSEFKYDSRGRVVEFYPKSPSCICETS